MSERTKRFVRELEMLGQLFSGSPGYAREGHQPDLIEIRPGIWVEARQPFDGIGPELGSGTRRRAYILEGLAGTLGLDEDEAQDLGKVLWKN